MMGPKAEGTSNSNKAGSLGDTVYKIAAGNSVTVFLDVSIRMLSVLHTEEESLPLHIPLFRGAWGNWRIADRERHSRAP